MERQVLRLDDYNIVVEDSLTSLNEFISERNYSKIGLIMDVSTKKHCYPYFAEKVSIDLPITEIVVDEGEENKNLETCKNIWRKMLEEQMDRESIVINLGGGVIGDMGGFAASCFKRGIDFVNIPTTVLSQVDASIGGKLGVDFEYGKNLIGMFNNPELVIVNPDFHATLSDREYLSGFAEIFKHALIDSPTEWIRLSEISDFRNCDITDVLAKALVTKYNIVQIDPFEKSVRKALNFGHTIGHALEAWSLENEDESLLHGEAIAVGMICEAYISMKRCGLKESEFNEIQEVLLKNFPKYSIKEESKSSVLNYMKYDKKNRGNRIMSVLLSEIGKASIDEELSQNEILESLAYYQSI